MRFKRRGTRADLGKQSDSVRQHDASNYVLYIILCSKRAEDLYCKRKAMELRMHSDPRLQ